MNDRAERIRDLADSHCRGKRYEAADAHVKAGWDIERILKIPNKPDPYHDFLAGWDAAMEVTCEELAEENRELHGIVTNLCARMCVEKCKACNGTGADKNYDSCPHCDDGWIDK